MRPLPPPCPGHLSTASALRYVAGNEKEYCKFEARGVVVYILGRKKEVVIGIRVMVYTAFLVSHRAC